MFESSQNVLLKPTESWRATLLDGRVMELFFTVSLAGGPGRGGRGALGTGGWTAVPCQGPLFWSALLLRRVVRARSGRRVKPVSPGRADAGAGRSLPGAGPGARSLAVGSSCSHWEPGKAMC